MSNIQLHEIIRVLADNPNLFVKEDYRKTSDFSHRKKSRKNDIQQQLNIKVETFERLDMYKEQPVYLFPNSINCLLDNNMFRFGVEHFDTFDNKQLSFINSFNITMTKNYYRGESEEQMDSARSLRNFIISLLPYKRRSKKKNVPKTIREKVENSEIDDELIQYVVNIFQINLMIIDLKKMIPILYYCQLGNNVDTINFFRPLNIISKIDDIYEPIISEETISNDSLYRNLLNNFSNVHFIRPTFYEPVFYVYFKHLDLPLKTKIYMTKNHIKKTDLDDNSIHEKFNKSIKKSKN